MNDARYACWENGCKGRLEWKNINDIYTGYGSVTCDACDKNINIGRVWHCSNENVSSKAAHPDGFDLCDTCFKLGKNKYWHVNCKCNVYQYEHRYHPACRTCGGNTIFLCDWSKNVRCDGCGKNVTAWRWSCLKQVGIGHNNRKKHTNFCWNCAASNSST